MHNHKKNKTHVVVAPRRWSPHPPSRGTAFTTVVKSAEDVLGYLPPWWLPLQIDCIGGVLPRRVKLPVPHRIVDSQRHRRFTGICNPHRFMGNRRKDPDHMHGLYLSTGWLGLGSLDQPGPDNDGWRRQQWAAVAQWAVGRQCKRQREHDGWRQLLCSRAAAVCLLHLFLVLNKHQCECVCTILYQKS